MSIITEFRSDRQFLCRRAQAGLSVLASDSHVEGRLAVVGYCFGGLVALELARSDMDLAAAVSVHGSLATKERATRERISCPILVCHGALDPHSPSEEVMDFINEMNAATADWQLVIYGGAMHGFTHENASGQTPGVRYDEHADIRSALAIEKFLADAFAM